MSGAGAADDVVRLAAIAGAPIPFEVVIRGAAPHAASREIAVGATDPMTGERRARARRLPAITHHAWLELFAGLAPAFGTRLPDARRPLGPPSGEQIPYRALLTSNLAQEVRAGYGDPAVLRVPDAQGDGATWYLLATSNDAPHAFPIARSRDLVEWSLVGFVFPPGRTPPWAAVGEHVADFWAPELHRVDGEYRVYFTARERDGHELAIGMARASSPEGPFAPMDVPILRGGVIDSHLLVDADGDAYLLWKEDANGVWPDRLCALLHARPPLAAELFAAADARATASLALTLWPWVRTLEPMERFFALHPLVEAVTGDFAAVGARLAALRERGDPELRDAVDDVLAAMRTPIRAQRLSADGERLVGECATVLVNDQPWEAHLVEGVWVTRQAGRYFLFYAGNDFSSAAYGIGVAVADHPLGPYRKVAEPFLRSTAEWWGPGHPSVADGPDGLPWLFLHAYRPGRTGYNEFRALLGVPVEFEGESVRVRRQSNDRAGTRN